MKSMLRFVNYLALIHLLALIGFVVWLWQSGRLNMDRVESVRETFSLTIADAAIADAENDAQVELARLAGIEEDRKVNPPISSAEMIGNGSIMREQERQTIQRLEDSKRLLQDQLDDAIRTMKELRDELAAREKVFKDTRDAALAQREDAQFKQIVQMYEGMAPRQAKQMLAGLVNGGQKDQAVEYLNAMAERPRTKILKEFKTAQEIEMATDLLESVRTLGQDVEPDGDPANAKPVAAAYDHIARIRVA